MEYERRKSQSKLKLYNNEIERLSNELSTVMGESLSKGTGGVKSHASSVNNAASTTWFSPVGIIGYLFNVNSVSRQNHNNLIKL